MWHFLFALFRFLASLINFRFLIFSGLSQTFGNSTPGLSEAEKLVGSGGKIIGLSQEEPILEQKQKKNYFIIYRLVGARPLRGRHAPLFHSTLSAIKSNS